MNRLPASLILETGISLARVLHPARLFLAACWAALIVFIVTPDPSMVFENPWLSVPGFLAIMLITAIFLSSLSGANEEESGD